MAFLCYSVPRSRNDRSAALRSAPAEAGFSGCFLPKQPGFVIAPTKLEAC
jgi:hypothetical protein